MSSLPNYFDTIYVNNRQCLFCIINTCGQETAHKNRINVKIKLLQPTIGLTLKPEEWDNDVPNPTMAIDFNHQLS